MSRAWDFPTLWYKRPAKPQISLRIPSVWSEPLIVAWVFYGCSATDWHHLEFLSLKRGCTVSSESTLVKMSNCWKSHAAAQILSPDTVNPLSFLIFILCLWASAWDFQKCDILTCVDSDEPLQPLLKLRNSKWCDFHRIYKRQANCSDQTVRMRRLIWGFAVRTYHIVVNLMSKLKSCHQIL